MSRKSTARDYNATGKKGGTAGDGIIIWTKKPRWQGRWRDYNVAGKNHSSGADDKIIMWTRKTTAAG
jgi:hypothetical protein